MTMQVSSDIQALIGRHIGNYRLVRLLGQGGMGMVFEAVHDAAGVRAAVKVLRPEILNRTDIAARFFNEARAANAVRHPGIVRIFDCGCTPDGVAFLTMELVEGESLRARLNRVQRLPEPDVRRLGRQLASALLAAHRNNVVHRDLKPDNVLLFQDPDLPEGERIKILDFGVAKMAESLRATPLQTRSGFLMGTPSYMAPEQCRGAKAVTERSDVYSLGIILYQCLAGRLPFAGEALGELLSMHMMDPVPPLTGAAPGVTPELASLIHRMLEKQPHLRPGMEGVQRELQPHEQGAGSNGQEPAWPPLPAGPTQRTLPMLCALTARSARTQPLRSARPEAHTMLMPPVAGAHSPTLGSPNGDGCGLAETARRLRRVLVGLVGASVIALATAASSELRHGEYIHSSVIAGGAAGPPPSVRFHLAGKQSEGGSIIMATATPTAGMDPRPSPPRGDRVAGRTLKEAPRARRWREAAYTLADAENDYKLGLYERAVFIAEKHLDKDKLAAWELIGRASCGKKEPARASRAYLYVKSDLARILSLLRACERHGFSFSNGVFQPNEVLTSRIKPSLGLLRNPWSP